MLFAILLQFACVKAPSETSTSTENTPTEQPAAEENVQETKEIVNLAQGAETGFALQCGLAPGFPYLQRFRDASERTAVAGGPGGLHYSADEERLR